MKFVYFKTLEKKPHIIMKITTYLFLACSLFILNVQAQNFPVDSGTGKITYMNTVEAKNMSAADIYSAANDWGKDNGLTVESAESNKKLVFSGAFKVKYRPAKGTTNEEGTVEYKLHVGTKEGKYRYILVDLVHKGAAGDGGKLENLKPECGTTKITNHSWSGIKNKTHSLASKQIESLQKHIQEIQNDPTKNDDW